MEPTMTPDMIPALDFWLAFPAAVIASALFATFAVRWL